MSYSSHHYDVRRSESDCVWFRNNLLELCTECVVPPLVEQTSANGENFLCVTSISTILYFYQSVNCNGEYLERIYVKFNVFYQMTRIRVFLVLDRSF